MAMPTLLDIAVINAADPTVGLIEEATQSHPEITMGAARTIPGQSYKTLVRTSLPTVSFRNANEGTAVSKSTFQNRRVETFVLNPPWECDRAVADRDIDGPEECVAREAVGILESAFQTLARQLYYGPSAKGDAKGFPGFVDAVDTVNMVVDATGTGSEASSVWAVKWGDRDVRWVWGEHGLLQVEDPILVRLTDGSSNPYMAYHQELLAYPGLQVGSKFSIGRIKNLTTGKGLTDDLCFDLLETFPTGKKPDMFLMTRRSQGQLRKDRTATNATGAPAPIPTEVGGVPIYTTEGILNTETAA